MKIIIGLGNPGKKYQNNRHNLGFLIINALAQKLGGTFEFNKKFQAEIAEAASNKEKIILVKPQTFMNNSGQTTRAILDFYKETPNNLIVIHDDVDISFGETKLTRGQSSAGHNGVESIISFLRTKDFQRLRAGIQSAKQNTFWGGKKPTDKFVLQNFSSGEKRELDKVIEKALSQLGF